MRRSGVSGRVKAFDELPALRVRGQTLRWSLRRVTIAWMFGVVWMSLLSGSQLTTFARLIGFKDFHFGLMAAIPFCATFAQLVAAIFIERTGQRKRTFIRSASACRLLWLLVPVLPFAFGAGTVTVAIFLSLYAVYALLAHFSNPAWQNWMGDLIPRRIRGRYFANRRLWTNPIQVAIVIAAGLLLDRYTVELPKDTPVTLANQPGLMLAICVLFLVGAVFGTIDILLFRKMREIVSPGLTAPVPAKAGSALSAAVRAVSEPFHLLRDAFGDRVFRHYALYGATIAFALSVSAQYFWLNALENLGYSKLAANVVFMVCGALSAMVVAKLWGKLIDRWGRRPVLILGTIGTTLGPAGWFLATRGSVDLGVLYHWTGWFADTSAALPISYLTGAATCIWGGAMWGGVVLAQTGVILGFSDSEGRSKHIAAASVVVAVGGAAGGLAGGGIAEALQFLKDAPLRVGPFEWINYHATFAVSALARAAAVLWLIGMPDPGSKPFRHIVREFGFNAYNNLATRLFWPIRAWRRRHRNGRAKSLRAPLQIVAKWIRRRGAA
ncbi:MAG TPA: MFS transporter [Phycisphaerae bacterium]|nr:MFS transporter [Phycisphaerae bacterium]